MKIYTKQGDSGSTSVYAKEVLRLNKDDILVETYGTLDELNSFIGLLISQLRYTNTAESFSQWNDALTACQHDLFTIGFALSDSDKLTKDRVDQLEQWIDDIQNQLSPQTFFILPGGSQLSAQAHVIRTIARRAERMMVKLSKHHSVNQTSIAYLNRMSDFMFVLARFFNLSSDVEDIKVNT